MNSNLLFDFTVNKENKTIHVKREFNTNLELVWKAWTTAELLDQWWGPKPWHVETKTMDFRENGFWLYAMVGPEGDRQWCRANYISIVKEKSFCAKDGFCDENGMMNPSFPQNLWENNFTTKGSMVEVDILLTFDTIADLEQTVGMNFKEGFTIGLQQLDKLLSTLQNK